MVTMSVALSCFADFQIRQGARNRRRRAAQGAQDGGLGTMHGERGVLGVTMY